MQSSWLELSSLLHLAKHSNIIALKIALDGIILEAHAKPQREKYLTQISSIQNVIPKTTWHTLCSLLSQENTILDIPSLSTKLTIEDSSPPSLFDCYLYPFPQVADPSNNDFFLIFIPVAAGVASGFSHKLLDIGLLATGLFHDLSNELTSITLLARQLASIKQEPTCHEKVNQLLERLLHIETISREVMRHVHSEKEISSSQGGCNVQKVLRFTLKMFELSLPKHITLHYDFDALTDIRLPISQGIFGHLVLNLLTNAKESIGSQKGEIHLSFQLDNETLILSVADSGKGIASHEMDKLFDPFYSTKSGKAHKGLGLTLCQNLATMAGGGITPESKPDGGAIFHLQLPHL